MFKDKKDGDKILSNASSGTSYINDISKEYEDRNKAGIDPRVKINEVKKAIETEKSQDFFLRMRNKISPIKSNVFSAAKRPEISTGEFTFDVFLVFAFLILIVGFMFVFKSPTLTSRIVTSLDAENPVVTGTAVDVTPTANVVEPFAEELGDEMPVEVDSGSDGTDVVGMLTKVDEEIAAREELREQEEEAERLRLEAEEKRLEEEARLEKERQEAASRHQVPLVNMGFGVGNLNIEVGNTVVWTNEEESVVHKIVISPVGVQSDRLMSGDAYEFTFGEPGRYVVINSIHKNTQIINVK